VEIFLHEIGVDEFQLDLLLMPFVYRVVGSSMAESSCCFRNCSRNSVCRLIFVSSLPLPTIGSWWSQWGSCGS
jgi:hypothetical protein